MAIERQVLESAIEVVFPLIGTGAAEGLGASASRTAADSLGAVASRLVNRLRMDTKSPRPSRDELAKCMARLASDPELARDMIVLAGAHLGSAGRDRHLLHGDGGHNQVGDSFSFGPVEINRGTTHFGSRDG